MINDKKDEKIYCFCRKNSKCPELKVVGERVILGGVAEGFTYWDKGHLEDFIAAAKNGDLDGFLDS